MGAGYLDLLAERKPEKLEGAAVFWHGLETEATLCVVGESQLAPAARASLCAGEGRRSMCLGDCLDESGHGLCHGRSNDEHAESANSDADCEAADP